MTLRFIADENLPRSIIAAMRALGMDVACVGDVAPGIFDDEVLALAEREGRVLVTLDKGFGDLVQRPAARGIILLRAPLAPPQASAELIAALIASRDDWQRHLSVIKNGRLRQRPLRKSP